MRARLTLLKALIDLGTLDGVREGHEHHMDMMRLCRSDNLGLRNFVPFVMLQLDLDQESYDFIKWWAMRFEDENYDSGDLTQPYLNLREADVFEDPDFLFTRFPDLNHMVAVLLLKLKLQVDIINLRTARKVFARCHVITDLQEQIERGVIRSPLAASLVKQSTKSLKQMALKLHWQILRLGDKLAETNSTFMFHLFDPDEALLSKPESYSTGSWEESALAIQFSYAAFWETEKVLPLLEDARACAAEDSKSEINDIMASRTFKSDAGSKRTAKELLEDMSVNRVWGYLAYATDNASYFGPRSERPSEKQESELLNSMVKAFVEEDHLEGLGAR